MWEVNFNCSKNFFPSTPGGGGGEKRRGGRDELQGRWEKGSGKRM